MKNTLWVVCILLMLVPLIQARGMQIGVGAFGGINIPIVQDDQGNGTAFGILGRFKVLSIFVVEPNITFAKWGSPDPIDGVDLGISGSKLTSFGADLTLGGFPGGTGFKPYLLAGLGIFSIKNNDTDYDESKLGFTGGLGILLGLSPMIALDLRGKAIIAPQKEGSKKAVLVTGGINYNFGGN